MSWRHHSSGSSSKFFGVVAVGVRKPLATVQWFMNFCGVGLHRQSRKRSNIPPTNTSAKASGFSNRSQGIPGTSGVLQKISGGSMENCSGSWDSSRRFQAHFRGLQRLPGDLWGFQGILGDTERSQGRLRGSQGISDGSRGSQGCLGVSVAFQGIQRDTWRFHEHFRGVSGSPIASVDGGIFGDLKGVSGGHRF